MPSKKKANGYEDLKDLYTKSMDLVTELDETVTTFNNIKDKIPEKISKELEGQVNTISSDVTQYRTKLEQIHDEHKDWKGRPKRPNQFMECHSIGNDYLQVMNSIIQATLPLAADVIATLNEGVTNE